MTSSTATAPIKDDATKNTSTVAGTDVKKDEPAKAVPASSDKK